MKLCIISFTENGILLSRKIEAAKPESIEIYTKWSGCRERDKIYVEEPLAEWTGARMEEKKALLFIGACGIAVRAIAPWVKEKLTDSPVLVIDEKGEYVIPLLSGHVGGANEIAVWLAGILGATPVITTATDLNHRFAVDMFAKRNHLAIRNKEGIAKVSSKVLRGEQITLCVQEPEKHLEKAHTVPREIRLVPYPPIAPVDVLVAVPDSFVSKTGGQRKTGEEDERKEDCPKSLLTLIPREYVLGVGCKKGKDGEALEQFLLESMAQMGICPKQIFALASIDVKKEEPGLLQICRKYNLPFLTYTASALEQVPGEFTASSFVKGQVGVDNVCERAALLGCGPEGKLIFPKRAKEGITLAVAKREWRISFDAE